MSLNKLIRIKESPIHGKGVFCAVPIPKGHYIGVYESTPSEEDGIYVLWVQEDDGTETGWDGNGDLRFLNHSFTPNAELDGLELYALRDIDLDEEIFIDYQWERDDEEHAHAFDAQTDDVDEAETPDDAEQDQESDLYDDEDSDDEPRRSGRVTLVSARS